MSLSLGQDSVYDPSSARNHILFYLKDMLVSLEYYILNQTHSILKLVGLDPADGTCILGTW